MPLKPLKPCREPGCPALTRGSRCDEHSKAKPDKRKSSARRGYDYRWQKLRQSVLREEPYCRACSMRPSEHVDHIVARAHGGGDERSNLQGLCAPCHSRKTAQERPGGFNARRGGGSKVREDPV